MKAPAGEDRRVLRRCVPAGLHVIDRRVVLRPRSRRRGCCLSAFGFHVRCVGSRSGRRAAGRRRSVFLLHPASARRRSRVLAGIPERAGERGSVVTGAKLSPAAYYGHFEFASSEDHHTFVSATYPQLVSPTYPQLTPSLCRLGRDSSSPEQLQFGRAVIPNLTVSPGESGFKSHPGH
jgi:hypothetical protein